jgi:hypothetical protein
VDVALATCRTLPEPDPDAAPLLDALVHAGVDAAFGAWDDPTFPWSSARLTLLRSTWNYPTAPDAFLSWAERVALVSELWNPIAAVRFDLHKRYLLDLEARGVPVAPTVLVRRGDPTPLAAILDAKRWDDVVIKPAISAASFRTLRAGRNELERGEAHLRVLARERDVLVQSYLPSVEGYGERSLIWVDGALTHAVRKTPRFSGESESVSTAAVSMSEAEKRLALRALACVEIPLLYARIDMTPGPSGEPVLMELELIEPSLFFDQGAEALERLVAGVVKRLSLTA